MRMPQVTLHAFSAGYLATSGVRRRRLDDGLAERVDDKAVGLDFGAPRRKMESERILTPGSNSLDWGTNTRRVTLGLDLSLERRPQRPRGRLDGRRDRRAPSDGLFADRRDRSRVWTVFGRRGHGNRLGVRLVVPPDQRSDQRDFAGRLQCPGRRGAGDAIGSLPSDLSLGRDGRTDPDSLSPC